MDNLLLKYMNERIGPERKKAIGPPGPVITISRECGCSGRVFAEKLIDKINQTIKNPADKWKWVNKEILCLASKELKINPHQIKDLLKGEAKTFLDDFASSFTVKYYGHDARVRRVIRDVVRHLAVDGRVVIVGRGSEAITQDIQRSLHIKLYAPSDWKINVISCRNKITKDEAEKIVIKTDKRRLKFVDAYLAKGQEKVAYDIDFNCAKFSQEEIIEMVLKAAEVKSLI
jgi:cytidylate kinase